MHSITLAKLLAISPIDRHISIQLQCKNNWVSDHGKNQTGDKPQKQH